MRAGRASMGAGRLRPIGKDWGGLRMRVRLIPAAAILFVPALAMGQYDDDPGYVDLNTYEGDLGEIDYDAPDIDYVWCDAEVLEDGTTIDGFYRPRTLAGFTWADGHYESGVWVSAGWQPTRRRAGFIWVDGYRGPDGYWVNGFWRPRGRRGFTWNDGHWDGGVWVV